MPRSLFIATAKQTGGIERVATQLARGLQDAGSEVLFAACDGGSTIQTCAQLGIATTVLNVRNSGDLGAIAVLARCIRRWRPDVVHVHSRRDYLPAVAALLSARIFCKAARSTRLVFHHHMLRSLGKPEGFSGLAFQRTVDRVIAVSGAVAAHLHKTHKLGPNFVEVIPNGVDTSRVRNRTHADYEAIRRDMRIELGLQPSDLAIGTLGRLDTKGQFHMVQILPTLLKVNPNVRLIMVGGEGQDNYRSVMDTLAAKLGVTDKVVFTGHVAQVEPLLTTFDLLAHLPEDEAFGLAIIEAMAAGLPVVASAIGGCSEIVLPGKTGVLISRDDERLADVFTAFIDPISGPALRTDYGSSALTHVHERYTLNAQVASVLALYDQIGRESSVSAPTRGNPGWGASNP